MIDARKRVFKELAKRLLCSANRLEANFDFVQIDGQMFFVEKKFIEWFQANEGANLSIQREYPAAPLPEQLVSGLSE